MTARFSSRRRRREWTSLLAAVDASSSRSALTRRSLAGSAAAEVICGVSAATMTSSSTTEDEFDALLGSLNFESIRLPAEPAPTVNVDDLDDDDYGQLQLSAAAPPKAKQENEKINVLESAADEESNARLGALPPLPASAGSDDAGSGGDSNRDFSHVDAASLDDILDLPDLPSSPPRSTTASSASPYGQFPTAPKHAVASTAAPLSPHSHASASSPRVSRPAELATTPGQVEIFFFFFFFFLLLLSFLSKDRRHVAFTPLFSASSCPYHLRPSRSLLITLFFL
jgi:hypothetical protein